MPCQTRCREPMPLNTVNHRPARSLLTDLTESGKTSNQTKPNDTKRLELMATVPGQGRFHNHLVRSFPGDGGAPVRKGLRLYAAITRGKRLVVVGSKKALGIVAKNDKTQKNIDGSRSLMLRNKWTQ